jgi:hypothetical protein
MANPITVFFRKLLFAPPREDLFVRVVTELAERTGQSKAQVLRNALNMYYRVVTLPEQDLSLIRFVIDDCEKKQGIEWPDD